MRKIFFEVSFNDPDRLLIYYGAQLSIKQLRYNMICSEFSELRKHFSLFKTVRPFGKINLEICRQAFSLN